MLIKDVNVSKPTTTTTTLLYYIVVEDIWINYSLKQKHLVWFMRQAGRYLPEYKKLRTTERTFLDLCFNSEKAAQISLQPIERFDFDFIILFSDILVVPHALGQFVDFKEKIGPVLEPINNKHDLNHNNLTNNLKILDPVFKTINYKE